jgi:hypothetical protein
VHGGAARPPGSETWKLHVKDVPRLSLDAVEAMSGGEVSLADLRHVRGWLEDDARYGAVAVKGSRGAPTTKMSDEWIGLLQQHGVVKEVARQEVRGWVHMFAVPEPAKQRFRPIKHTRDVNDAVGKETLMELRFPTKHEICDLVHHGECFIALDFAAYFDQFEYSATVGSRFCFRRGKRYYRLNTLAMGQRQAVEVAACTTARLLDFAPRSKTASIIDNVIFVGSRADVVRDATIFVERVRAAGALLNEDVSDIDKLVATSGDWGGIHLDFTAKTSCLARKTLDKTECSWRHRASWTWRTLAAHIGLLFWSWQILTLPMPDFFDLFRFVSDFGRRMTDDDARWDEPARVWDSVWPVLEQWTMLVMRNAPRVVPRAERPEWIVCTDASEWGWGYFAVHNVTGVVRMHGEPWSAGFKAKYGDRLGVSTFTEPQAVVNSLCHLLDPTVKQTVRVLTDNTVTQASFQRGHNGHSYHINECMRRLRAYFGDRLTVDFVYLPGPFNPGDGLSRGRVIAEGKEVGEVSAELRRIVGLAVCPRDLRFTAHTIPRNLPSGPA